MLKIAVFALCYSPLAFAQEIDSLEQTGALDESAFTFTEAQLGEDDDMSWDISSTPSVSAIARLGRSTMTSM